MTLGIGDYPTKRDSDHGGESLNESFEAALLSVANYLFAILVGSFPSPKAAVPDVSQAL
jgi:hypothetical protein